MASTIPKSYKNTTFFFCYTTAIFLSAFFIMPKIVLAQIVINEIMYDLAGADDKHEWVELYNNGSSPVDLTDYKFNDGDTATNHTLNAPPKNNSRGSMIINAGGYALLAGDAATLITDLPNYTGTIIDTVLTLSNTNATLKFLDNNGLEVTTTAYNKEMGSAGNSRTLEWDGAALKESMIDGGTPGSVNSVLNPTSFSSPTPTPTPSAPNNPTPTPSNETVSSASQTPAPTYQYSQDILINEFLPNPETGDKEWVELINIGSSAINLSDWQIDDEDNPTSPQVIPVDTIIPANGFLVISFNKSTLNNDGDKVRLLWPNDQVVHVVSYDKAKSGQAVAKFSGYWLWTNQPTPGQANKKSLAENSAAVSLAAAPNSDSKITVIEEAIAIQTSAPRGAATNNQNTITPIIAPPENISAIDPGAPNPNLIAAAGEPIKNSSDSSTVLILAGVIILSALTAVGLIYFRRQKQIDIERMDD